MNLLRTLARVHRGEINILILAALMAVLVLPLGGQAVAMPRESYEAVLIWIQSETALKSPLPRHTSRQWFGFHRDGVTLPDLGGQSAASSFTSAALTTFQPPAAPSVLPALAGRMPAAANPLSLPVVAHLNGVRTNRRLN